MFNWSGSQEETKQQMDPSDQEFQMQLDKIVEKSDQLQQIQSSAQNDAKQEKQVSSHFSLTIPLIELLIINKHLGSYNSSKCFMQIALQDFFFQNVGYSDGQLQALYALRNFQVVDKLVANERFQKVIFLTPKARPVKKTKKHQERKNSLNSSLFSMDSGSVQNMNEIEEEDRPFINNGLPKIRTFQDSLKKISDSFLVFQVMKSPMVSQEGLVDKIKIDLFVNHTSFFYNRALISQAETFFHRATVNQVQNASAEDDFENQKQQLFQQTEQQLQVILRQSHFELGCTLQGIDVLVPDDTNFEQSKFILVQTGNCILRSKSSLDVGDKSEATAIDPHFCIILDKTVQKLQSQSSSQEVQQISNGQMAIVQRLQKRRARSNWDEYVANCYDFRMLYVPTSKELETVFSREMETSQNQVERQYSILRKTDISADFSSFKQEGIETSKLVKVCFSITALDLRFTNKEVKELKYFADKFKKYHEDLRDQVFQQYVRIVKESQTQIKKVKTMPLIKPQISSSMINISAAGGIFANKSTHNLLAKSYSVRKRAISGSSNASGGTNDDFQDAIDNFSDARSRLSKPRLTGESDSDDDGFYDAQDYFDPEILNMLKLDKNMETITEEIKTERPSGKAKENNNLCFYLQAQVNKISVQILESQDFRAEIVKNLKNAMTQRIGSEERQQSSQWMHLKDDVKNISENLKSRYYIELKIKQKGTPFLNFEISKFSAAFLHVPAIEENAPKTEIASLIIRDICLTNKLPTHSQVIMRSANHIIDDQVRFSETGYDDARRNSLDYSVRSETSYQKKKPPMPGGRLYDLEDEDNMLLVEDLQDNFITVCLLSQQSKRLVDAEISDDEVEDPKILQKQKVVIAKIELGLLEAEITDYTIKKIIETLVTDFPVSNSRHKKEDLSTKTNASDEAEKSMFIETVFNDFLIVSDGLHCKLRVQQSEISHLKIIGLKAQISEKNSSSLSTLRLEDFQILHEDNELVFRHNFDTQLDKKIVNGPQLWQSKPPETNQNFFDYQAFDFAAIAPDSPQILCVEFEKKASQKSITCNLSNLLVITDLQATTKIVQNVCGLLLALSPFKPISHVTATDDELAKASKKIAEISVNFTINGFHLQVPVSRDSKNFLFWSIDTFIFEKRRHKDEGVDFILRTAFDGIECFVAKQIDQLHKYFLIQVLEVDLQAFLPPEEPAIPKDVTVSIGKVQLNINDNFLLLLTSIVEHHTQDLVDMQSSLANLISFLKIPQTRATQSLPFSSDAQKRKVSLSRKSLRKYAKNSPFIKSVIAQEKVIQNQEGLNIRTYCQVKVNCVQIQWIFEMSFDDHVENFQTLNNRNFSKQVLSRLETKQETLIMPQFNYGSDPDSPMLSKPEKLSKMKRQNLSFNNYKRLAFTLHSVLLESAQSQGPAANSYLNFTVNTGILDHHQTEFNSNVKQHAGTAYVSQYDPSIVSEYPIMIFRSIQNDGQLPSQNSQSQAEQLSELKQRYKDPDAIIVGSAFNKLQGNISLVDIRCCQMNLKVLANLVSSAYSCKNLLQHGKKRLIMKNLLKSMSGAEGNRKVSEQKLEYVVGVKKFRFICFDSQSQPETKQKGKSSRDQSLARTIQDYDSNEQIKFKPNSLLIAECAFQINNQEPPQLADEDAELQANKQFNLRASSLEIYMNSARTNLIDLLVQGSCNRAVMLYPTEIIIESQQFFGNRNLRINDVQVSMIEFETSFRQMFNLNLLMNKLSHELQPIQQIFARINTTTDFKVSKERVGQQRSKSQGRRTSLRRSRAALDDKPRETRKDVNFAKESQKESQKGVMIIAVKVQSIYIALIRESGYLPVAGSQSVPLLPNEMNCLPLLSLEIKWVQLESKFQVNGLQQTDIQFPFELYYFNQKLAFFEPAIEKVLLKASIDSDLKGNSEQRLVVENVLNVNFSVALYESLFLLNENYQEERKVYQKALSKEAEDYLPDQLREIGNSKPELLLRQKNEVDQLLYSTSTFFIRNKTGEMLLFKAGRQPVFTEMQNNDTLPLDFNSQPPEDTQTHLLNLETGSKGLFDGIASSDMQPSSEFVSNLNSDDLDETESDIPGQDEIDQEQQNLHMEDQRVFKMQKTRSMFRRGKFRLKKSEPNIVLLQVLIQQGKELNRTESFEINFNLLSCQRVFLDDNRKLYVICQIQNKDGQKILVVRSPMQVTNNLQIPIEVQLCIPQKKDEDSDLSQLVNPLDIQIQEDDRAVYYKAMANPLIGLGAMNFEERLKNLEVKPKVKYESAMKYTIVVKAESSVIIPLKACSFESVQIRPIIQENPQPYAKDISQFEWSEEANICLLQEESDIFETKPIILSSKLASQRKHQDAQNEAQKSKQKSSTNNVFFALNANTFSIRSFIDFNTQKTEFISLRYLSVTAPFVFENLIPVPITMLFKNVSFNLAAADHPQEDSGNSVYDLTLKHNSSLQVLYLNPEGSFEFSLAIPGFDHSTYARFRIVDGEQANYDSYEIDSPDIKLKNYSQKQKKARELDSDSDVECNIEMDQLAQRAPFRFLKQRKLLFEMHSQFQNQFNICGNIALIQGFYQISFYSKFWLLNNTKMPLQFRVTHNTQSFPPLDLPFHSNEFDFETSKHFANTEVAPKTISGKRKDSGETLRESRTELQDDTISEYPITEKESVSYIRKHICTMVAEEKRTNDQEILFRLKPWESYRAQGRDNDGLMAALTQEDISRVSSIYFTQEMLSEETKDEFEESPQKQFKPESLISPDQSNNKPKFAESSESQLYLTAAQEPSSSQRMGFSNVSNHQPSKKNAVTQNDTEVAKKRTVQFQDASIIIEGSLASSNNPVFNQGVNRSLQNLDASRLDKFERLTKTSKTSIQLQSFSNNQDVKLAQPLNSLKFSRVELYDAPLNDKDQLKRVILFSDTENCQTSSQIEKHYKQSEIGEQSNFLLGSGQQQNLKLKVCDSEWATIPFDLARLHTGPIQIIDSEHTPGSTRPRAMFELVAVVTFLPAPFSFSKLICFQPRYMMVNRTFHTIQVVQAQCEELGTFKIFPQETSVFHWTDCNKSQQISVKMADYEFSGSIDIDKIGEWNLRLKSSYGLAENIIINVSISEEANSLYIVFTDISHAPPYRVENLTKSRFNIAQAGCRLDDFDRLEPYSTRSFAWSCPLQKKELKISLCNLQQDEDLGKFYIDSIQERELIKIRDRERKKQFILEITSEKTMKVLRIMYPHTVPLQKEQEKGIAGEQNVNFASQKLIIERLGLSIVNSQARELSYTTISNLRFSHESTMKHQKLSLRVGDVQMDNQVSRQYDAIIFKRQQRDKNRGDFFCLKFNKEKNLSIENLIVFKYIIVAIVPFNIMIDGTFCDEIFLYGKDVVQLIKRYTLRKKHLEVAHCDFVDHQNTLLNQEGRKKKTWVIEKEGALDLKKKGQPIVEQRDMQKIFIENFLIGEINFSLTFAKRPVVFREFTMPPFLKFLISMLSRMSKVQLSFNKYHVQHEHMLVSIFLARLNQFYKNEFINHKQLLNLFSQMGIFTPIYEAITTVWNTTKSIVFSPLQARPDEENLVKAIFLDSFVFVKDYCQQLSGSVADSILSLKSGFEYIANQYGGQNEIEELADEDRVVQSIGSPLNAIETQNQLWLKVIIREVQSTDGKKYKLKKQNKQDQMKELKHARRVLDVRKKPASAVSNITTIATSAAMKVANLPTKIKQAYSGVVTTFITGTNDNNGQLQKVRPPRFVGFTMELEPYSKKKAFVLQILNDINLNVFEAETIQKMYNLNNHTVIVTGKRIICVDEQRCITKDLSTGTGLFAKVRSKRGTQNVFNGSIAYRHWNILFKDIYRVSLDMVNRETGKILQKAELERVFMENHNLDDDSQSQERRDIYFERKLMFVLRIHYQMEIDEEFLMFDDGSVSLAPTRTKDNPDLMSSVQGGLTGFQKMFGEKKKKNYELLNKGRAKGGLMDGLSGLMVGRKDIQAKIKDFRVIKRISRDVEEKLALDRKKRSSHVHDDTSNESLI